MLIFTIFTEGKQQLVGHFFTCLECSPSSKKLAKLVSDPLNPSETIRQFFVSTQGLYDTHKRKIVAECLTAFYVQFVMKPYQHIKKVESAQQFADAQYQPNSVATHFRTLFAYFKQEGITYLLHTDFNNKGTFCFDFDQCLHFYVLFRAFNYNVPSFC